MRINWLGVIISAIIIMLLRRAWYAHFGGADWGTLPGMLVRDIQSDTTLAGKELLNALVLSAALGWLIDGMRNRSLPAGLFTGLAAAIGFGVTSISSGYIHGGPLKSLLIDGGCLLASYVLAGAILGATAPRRSSRAKFDWSASESSAAEH